jgi:hypothetical protein
MFVPGWKVICRRLGVPISAPDRADGLPVVEGHHGYHFNYANTHRTQWFVMIPAPLHRPEWLITAAHSIYVCTRLENHLPPIWGPHFSPEKRG